MGISDKERWRRERIQKLSEQALLSLIQGRLPLSYVEVEARGLEAKTASVAHNLAVRLVNQHEAYCKALDTPCDELTPHERDLVNSNKLIPAIKAVRARTGLSLRDSKRVVDRYRLP